MADDTKPVDFLPPLPPRTELEQLTDALNAGLITPALFALAKEKLLQSGSAAPAAPPQPSSAPRPTAPTASEPSSGELPPLVSFFTETPPASTPAPPTAPARVAPVPAPSQPVVKTANQVVSQVAPAPVAPTSRQPAEPTPAATPGKPAPYVDFLGTSAAAPPPAPRLATAVAPPATAGQLDPYGDLLDTPPPPAAPPVKSAPPALPPAAPPTSRSVMPKVLLALAVLGVLWLIYWQVAGSHPDEQLTSPRQPATSVTPVAAKTQHKKRSAKVNRLKSRKLKKSKLVVATPDSALPTPTLKPNAPTPERQLKALAATPKPAAPTKPASAPATPSAPPEAVPRAVPPAPEPGDTEAAIKVRATMASYYADMLAPPFSAARHFAPHVERLYIQQNLTPPEIDERFNRNFFPDNKQAVLQIEPGTLHVSAPAADGTCMATFVEASNVYHPSRQLYQRMRAQVRARFNADFQIIYLRQERLLESTLE